jgi:hypothetical protein
MREWVERVNRCSRSSLQVQRNEFYRDAVYKFLHFLVYEIPRPVDTVEKVALMTDDVVSG